MSFDKAVGLVLEHEGGYSFDPMDHGGATNFGITQADLSAYRLTKCTPEDVRHMTKLEAMLIYRKFYWNMMKLDQVKSEKLQMIFMDQGVLSGVVGCISKIQRLVGSNVDGVMGPITIGAINAASPESLGLNFIIQLQSRYIDIVLDDETQGKFLKGWISRTHDLLRLII